ncbi:fibrinogen-like YCDxxxxGGGW domain-containing protein [Archangium sp.]|uniref:RCC1 domain-containing protein n=1 Tax=Archangium sp. TaxID=1872627 RepID=UPI002D2F12B0|nr:fibrinogen-like YCDxxxxGGGW domain-containing protein [Archangium sp.]HYO59406.1 fibrinogen-like YCDxxxxGGGW domain-containing protein [Archangium sp.]
MRQTAFHLLLLVLLGPGLGCKSPLSDEPSAAPGAETVTVSFSIGASELLAPSQGAGTSARVSGLGFSFQDVTRVRIGVLVREAAGGTSPLFRDVDLSKGTDGLWSGQLPFLPKNKPLSFVATASNASGTALFRGSTDQTLTEDNTAVSIFLAPVIDANITLPRVQRITVPAELFPEQSFPLRFLVEARAGERLDYVIEGVSGTFAPSSQGSLVLEGTSATIVIHYIAPQVGSATDFTHSIRLTNRDGHSVSTTFRLRVRPPSSEGVRDTSVAVRFNPVINALSAVRVPGAPQVAFEASVSDDRPLSELSYAWSLTPEGSEAPTFSPQANPTLLQGYTLETQGTLLLAVKDAEGGTTTLRYVLAPNQFPDNPTADHGFTSLLAGEGHTCALLDTGKVRCWGRNDSGQLGQGHTRSLGDDEPLSTVGDVPLADSTTQLAVGGHHTCAMLEGGAVRCWGRNDSGQLGYGHTLPLGDDESPSSSGYVPFGGRAVELVAGAAHTCALLDTGAVRCWGHNAHGQLGYRHTRAIGDDELPSSAGAVDVGGTVRHLAAGAWHTCALLTTGAVRCWGRNDSGQLGLGHTRPIGDDETPASVGEVSVGGSVVELATSSTSQHTCARLASSAVRCWGRNAHGQLGLGHTYPIGDDEVASAGSPNTGDLPLQLATGAEHTCVLLSPGLLKCWGRNESGQLGQGNTAPRSTPHVTPVDLGGTTAFQVSAGAWHTCVLLSSGEPRCWGRNTHGQLGLGHTFNLGDDEPPSGGALTTPRPPVVVEALPSAASVGGGGSLSLLVQAMDPQASRLSFSWTMNTGTLSTATTATDSSEVSWTAPSCIPSGVTPTVTATVTNAFGLVSTKAFTPTVTAGPCVQASCKAALVANPAASSGVYTLDPDGNGPFVAFKAFCDMTTAGGGWTVIEKSPYGNSIGRALYNDVPVNEGSPELSRHRLSKSRMAALSSSSTDMRIDCRGKDYLVTAASNLFSGQGGANDCSTSLRILYKEASLKNRVVTNKQMCTWFTGTSEGCAGAWHVDDWAQAGYCGLPNYAWSGSAITSYSADNFATDPATVDTTGHECHTAGAVRHVLLR